MNRKKSALLRIFSCNLVFNTILAFVLTPSYKSDALSASFILIQLVGFSALFLSIPALYSFTLERLQLKPPIIMTFCLAILMVAALSIPALLGEKLPSLLRNHYGLCLQAAVLNVMFITISGFVTISLNRIASVKTMAEQERVKRTLSETKAAEMSLRLLQAQIEPHFLFNTLSNVLHLIDTDIEKGKQMLTDFIDYLRASLSKTRAVTTTLEQEAELLRAYLEIFKVRMGDRLDYTIEIADHLKSKSIPSMVLQPLVENALSHGLQPKLEGGSISIHAEERNGVLCLEVCDTGIGLQVESDIGIGLRYVKERLRSPSFSGPRGRLVLEENRPTGLRALIELDQDADQSDYCR